MHWEKSGHVFAPGGKLPWMRTHAANPFAWKLDDSNYKVYFTCRDEWNRSHIGYVILDFDDNFKVLEVSSKPVLEPGNPGLFDDSGVMMGYLLPVDKKLYLYYLGWNLKVTVPWLNSVGLAISDDGGATFHKFSEAPVLDRSHEDPYSISYPSVMQEGAMYRMWYGSNLSWGKEQHEMKHVIKHAESPDGLRWVRDGRPVVPLKEEYEYALSKPFVMKINHYYIMWYSYRASSTASTYRIGWAFSDDGLVWQRKDESVGITVSPNGWDSEMVEYPTIVKHRDRYVMLYNGNGYGATGFGVAFQHATDLEPALAEFAVSKNT